jgi:hypothetical protein
MFQFELQDTFSIRITVFNDCIARNVKRFSACMVGTGGAPTDATMNAMTVRRSQRDDSPEL